MKSHHCIRGLSITSRELTMLYLDPMRRNPTLKDLDAIKIGRDNVNQKMRMKSLIKITQMMIKIQRLIRLREV